MFRIDLQLEQTEISGLDALDKRRVLGLEGRSALRTDTSRTDWFPVSEEFARMHFSRTQSESTRIVSLNVFVPGELEDTAKGVSIKAGLSVARACELWVGGGDCEE